MLNLNFKLQPQTEKKIKRILDQHPGVNKVPDKKFHPSHVLEMVAEGHIMGSDHPGVSRQYM
jgi:hypothetical protein